MTGIQTVGAEGHVAGWQSVLDARRLLLYLCLFPLLVLRVWMLWTPKPLSDFFVYWSAGHLFLTGGQPYSSAAMYATQQLQGWNSTKHLVMLCPPWSLPVVAILALLPFQAAQLVWHAVSLVLDSTSSLALWSYFGGERRKTWIAIAVCITFVPMGFAEWIGQITPLILASLTAFLFLIRSKRYFLAGVVLLGFGLKPQLLFLVTLAILLWAVRQRTWAVLAGGATSYGIAIAFAFLWNRHSIEYFSNSYGPTIDTRCGLGGAMRSVFGEQHVWLQVLPTLAGLAWFAYYWIKNRRTWDWHIHLPLLLLASICSAPYFWFHDFLLIVPAIIALTVHASIRSSYAFIGYAVVQVLVFAAALPSVWMCAASVLWIAVYWMGTLIRKRAEFA